MAALLTSWATQAVNNTNAARQRKLSELHAQSPYASDRGGFEGTTARDAYIERRVIATERVKRNTNAASAGSMFARESGSARRFAGTTEAQASYTPVRPSTPTARTTPGHLIDPTCFVRREDSVWPASTRKPTGCGTKQLGVSATRRSTSPARHDSCVR